MDTTVEDRKIVESMKVELYKWMALAAKWEKLESMKWYPQAHDFAVYLSKEYHITVEQAAAVISVLSPGNNWDRNMTDADLVCQAWKNEDYDVQVGTYRPQLMKAWNILTNGARWSNSEMEAAISQPTAKKTRSFYHNILDPKDPRYITIDRWILRALGLWTNSTTPRLYALGETAISEVAQEKGVVPCILQAFVWVVIRNRGGLEQPALDF